MIGPVREREHFVDKRAIAKCKASDMGDKSITKVSAAPAPRGPMGQKYLASGIRLSMRLWESESPDTQPKVETAANYETSGYVIAGRAELHIEGQVVDLEPGDSWIVPKGSLQDPGSVHSAGGHLPARGSARPGQKRASRLNHASLSRL